MNFKSIRLMLCLCFLASCEKDNTQEVLEEFNTKRFERITLQEVTNRMVSNDDFLELRKMFDVNRSDSSTNKNEELDDITILTDDIVAVSTEDGTDYTFKVLANTENGEFYNLVIETDVDGVIVDDKFIKYKPSESWLLNPLEPFSGTVSSAESDTFSVDDLNFRRSGRCVTNIEYEWECNAGNDHAPDTCTAGGSDLIIWVTYGDCASDGQEDTTIDAGDDGNGDSNGGGYSGGTNTTPLPPCPLVIGGVYGSDCLDPDEYNIALEINQTLDTGDSWDIYDGSNPSELLSFNTVAEFENFLENMKNAISFEETEVEDNMQNNTTITKFKAKFALITPVYLNVHIKSTLNDAYTPEDEFELLDVASFESGVTPFLEWEQDSFSSSVNGNTVNVIMYGHFNIGISIGGFDFTYSDSYITALSYNKNTGDDIDFDVVSSN